MSDIQFTVGGEYSVLDRLQKKVSDVSGAISAGFTMRIGMKVFDGILGVVSQLPEQFKKMMDAGGKLQDQMTATGAAGEGLVVMGRALENAGMSGDSTATILARLQKAIAGLNEDAKPTGEAFAALGLSMDTLRGMDPVAAFETVGKAIAAIPDPAQRAAAAVRIFGKSGAELLAVFRDAGSFDLAREQVGQLGKTLTANASSMDAIGDAMGAIDTKNLQFQVGALEGLLPGIESAAVKLAAIDFTDLGRAVGGWINGLGQFFVAMTEKATAAWEWLTKVSTAARVIDTIISGGVSGFQDWVSGMAYEQSMASAAAAAIDEKTEATTRNTTATTAAADAVEDESKALEKAADLRKKYDEAAGKNSLAGMNPADRQAALTASRDALLAEANKAASWKGLNSEELAGQMQDNPPENPAVLADVMEKLIEIAALEKDIAAAAKDAASENERMAATGRAFTDELAMLQAKAAADEAEIERITRKKETEAEYQKLRQAGYDESTSAAFAADMAAAKAAEREAERERKRQQNAATAADAADALAAAMGDKGAEQRLADRATAARAADLASGGMDPAEAQRTARAEAATAPMADLRSRLDDARSNGGNVFVDAMQRVGGGGGAVGFDYARLQVDLQRRMVDLLQTIATGGGQPATSGPTGAMGYL